MAEVLCGHLQSCASNEALFFLFQHWAVFQEVKDLLTLVPPLVGLKGNLEMTLASRLSTSVSGSWMSWVTCTMGTGCSLRLVSLRPHPHRCYSALASHRLFWSLLPAFCTVSHGYPELLRDQHSALVPSFLPRPQCQLTFCVPVPQSPHAAAGTLGHAPSHIDLKASVGRREDSGEGTRRGGLSCPLTTSAYQTPPVPCRYGWLHLAL